MPPESQMDSLIHIAKVYSYVTGMSIHTICIAMLESNYPADKITREKCDDTDSERIYLLIRGWFQPKSSILRLYSKMMFCVCMSYWSYIFIFLHPPLPSWEFWQGHFQSQGVTQQQEAGGLTPIHQDKTGSTPPNSKQKCTFRESSMCIIHQIGFL